MERNQRESRGGTDRRDFLDGFTGNWPDHTKTRSTVWLCANRGRIRGRASLSHPSDTHELSLWQRPFYLFFFPLFIASVRSCHRRTKRKLRAEVAANRILRETCWKISQIICTVEMVRLQWNGNWSWKVWWTFRERNRELVLWLGVVSLEWGNF